MSEKPVQLIEQNVKHHAEDIRELKKRVSKAEEDISTLKTNQEITSQSVSHIMNTLTELKSGFQTLDDKLDSHREEQLKNYHRQKEEQLKDIRNLILKIVVPILVLFLSIQLGLQ